jgi:hypothetical protein
MGIIIVAIALLVLGGILYPIVRNRARDTEAASDDKEAGFRESGRQSGLLFFMNFLPEEQGENFKVNLYDHGCGVAVGDFDGDGHEDMYLCNQLGYNALFRNKGDGTFEDVTRKAGVALGDRVCVAATFADYDNDGHQDLYVTSTRGGNILFHNRGDGTFEDVTAKAGLALVAHSQTAAFFDYNNDGLLDLFVTNTAKWTMDKARTGAYSGPDNLWQMAASPHENNVLYRNNGNGTFTDVTAKAGLQGKGWGGDVAIFDFDEDGHMDVFVTNMFGANQLYRNNGDGTFTDVTKRVLGRTSFGAIGSKAFDFNNDGRLDLFIADMHSDMWLEWTYSPHSWPAERFRKKYDHVSGPLFDEDPKAQSQEQRLKNLFQLRYQDLLFGNTLFKKLPSGQFAEVSDKAGMETWWPWGVATGDFDNDGFEDVFLPSGMGFPYDYWPSALMMNNGDETFTDRATQLGIEPPAEGKYGKTPIGGKPPARSARCAATADFDGDGRLELVVNNFNDRASYFKNQFPQQNYIAFRLTGTRSNRDAIGALVRIYMGNEVMVRQVHAAGGYLSQSSRTLHFGLGRRSQIDRVEIRWPKRNKQSILAPPINTLHRVSEG